MSPGRMDPIGVLSQNAATLSDAAFPGANVKVDFWNFSRSPNV